MFTRIVECHLKPERKQEFENKLRNEVLPILQKQPGFVDLIALDPEDGGERQLSTYTVAHSTVHSVAASLR